MDEDKAPEDCSVAMTIFVAILVFGIFMLLLYQNPELANDYSIFLPVMSGIAALIL